MYRIITIVIALLVHHIGALVEVAKMNTLENHLFSDKPYGELYWHVFVHAANNDYDQAHKLAEMLKAGDVASSVVFVESEKPAQLKTIFNHVLIRELGNDAQLLSSLGLLESLGINDHNRHLNNVSPDACRARIAAKRQSLAMLKECSLAQATDDQRVAYQVISWLMQHQIDGERFILHEYRVNQMCGQFFDISLLLTQYHSIANDQDARCYLDRLQRIGEQFKQTIEFIDEQRMIGITYPIFALEKTIAQLVMHMPSSLLEHPFYLYFSQQLEALALSNKEELLDQALTILEHQVYPAYAMVRDYCEEFKDQLSTEHGVWALPHGDAYYDYMLKHYTTTTLTAEQIHELGLQEVDRIQQQMRVTLASIGIADENKTVGELMVELGKNPAYYYANTQEGRQQCLRDYQAILDRCKKELHPLFGLKPKSAVVIAAVPVYAEEGAPGAYYIPSTINGSRPGTFFANLRDMREVPTYSMETLAIHEAEPGHHFQVAVQQESDMPFIAKMGLLGGGYHAYIEGWALYVEKLAYEQGFYSSPASELGHLRDELWRAVRLVVDTGIHRKRWTKEQAVEYMVANTGTVRSGVITEIERYFVIPGQACSYKIGQLKILELRDRARKALGNLFTIQAFHDLILRIGACPLTLLEEIVDSWITSCAH